MARKVRKVFSLDLELVEELEENHDNQSKAVQEALRETYGY